jgi:hypothetical protein
MNTLVGALNLGFAIGFNLGNCCFLFIRCGIGLGFISCKNLWDFDGMWEEVMPLGDMWMLNEIESKKV